MEALLILLLFPLVWPVVAKKIWPKAISTIELCINIGLVVVLVFGIWQLGRYSQMSDTEMWNGEVTNKKQTRVSCSHSYECHCRTVSSGTGSNRTTRRVCDTCYEHANDWDWDVYSTAGNFSITRVDKQGSREPARWTKVKVGDPVASEHSYTNYIKAAPDSLFNTSSSLKEKFKGLLPEYPKVFDYQYSNRVIPMGLNFPEKDRWNTELALALRKLGPTKQANAIILVVNTPGEEYVHTLEEHWLGGKKNDVVVVLGVTQYPKIDWVFVMSWTKAELFKVELRDALLALGTVKDTPVVSTIETNISKSFVRRKMAEFEYLKKEIDPPTWVIVFAVLVAIGGSVGLSLVFRNTDL